MEFESKLAQKIASGRRESGKALKRVFAIALVFVMAATAFCVAPRVKAEMILLDEVNIGDPMNEGMRIDGWSHTWTQGVDPGGWGGFDLEDPYATVAASHNLRTVWAWTADDSDANWATVTLDAKTQGRMIVLRALDGLGDDSFSVYVNEKPVYVYVDQAPTWDASETWYTHEMPVKCQGIVTVKIVSEAAKWPYFNPWGQLGVNWVRIYGVGGFDMFGYNYEARMFIGTYDSSDRYLDGTYLGGTGDYVDDVVVMKWSKGWDDARFYGAPWTPEAWLTNHIFGDYVGDDGATHQYTYFVKIIWVGGSHGNVYPYIWNEFEIVEEVYNDPFAGYHGLLYKSEPGLG